MIDTGPVRIRFWGVRGSYPAPGAATVEVGGNTVCVEIAAGGHTLIFDAGTGIIPLGRDLLARESSRVVHCFISHTHHDHVEGMRFFEPLYTEGWTCWIYGFGASRDGVGRVLNGLMRPPLFPVTLRELPGRVNMRSFPSGAQIVVDDAKPTVLSRRASPPPDRPVVVTRQSRAHPKPGVTMYRFTVSGRSIVYASDVEAAKGGSAELAFARGADILIHDAQYLDEEYYEQRVAKVGWGHSTVRMAAEMAKEARVSELILFHHEPKRSDAEMARLERLARSIFPPTRAAREGMELQLL